MINALLLAAIEVVAVYYPHWHRYPKGDEWFGPAWSEGEWGFVKSAVPRYPGHHQPMKPLCGYLNGSDPKDVETEIALASNAGIDVFLYDYYYYGGKVTQEEALEKGFLKAANRDRIKFALMWCYHERVDQFRPAPGPDRRTLMTLDHTPEEFLGLIDLSIERYFPRPEYWRKDGRIFFSIFNARYFLEKLGEAGVRNALVDARRKVRDAGLGEIHFNAQFFRPEEQSLAKRLGFDSVTDYNIAPDSRAGYLTDYESMARNSRTRWAAHATGPLPYFPVVSTGWDRSARCRNEAEFPWTETGYPYGNIITNATPENFEKLLREAKAYVERDPKKANTVYINAWNEYTECPGLLPTVRDLDLRLRAVGRVFGRKPADRFVSCQMKKWWRRDAENGRAFEIDAPTSENVKYGPHPRQGMDVWLPGNARGRKTPCVIYIHGGAWVDGNRIDDRVKDLLAECRKKDVALVSISYRMISDANDEGVKPPVKAPVNDAIAAVRCVLDHARDWGIDPKAVGLTGGSAGACSSLIASFRDGNPLGVKAVFVKNPQTSLDPKEMREWIPNIGYGAHAFGFPYSDFEGWLQHREDCLTDIEAYSPAALARRIDPVRAPVVLYSCGRQPGPGELVKDPTHAPQFCARFEEICRERGIACRAGTDGDFLAALRTKPVAAPRADASQLSSLARFLVFLKDAIRTCPDDRTLKFYGSGQGGHWAVQANQQIAAVLAILAEIPDAELKSAGSPCTAAELGDLALALFRYSLRTHKTGDCHCTDGKQWGRNWISVLGLERAAGGTNFIEKRMSDEDRRRLREILAFECDYRLESYPIKGGIVTDNVPESNLWNAGVMFRVASHYPDLPNASAYVEKARRMMLNGLSYPGDSDEPWFVGANFTDEWALDHHGYLNVGYMYESLSNLAFLHFDFLDRGKPEPPELMHNVESLWKVCKTLTFPDGRLCRIGGDTRVRYAYCQLFAMQAWALAAHALGDDDAARFLREYKGKILLEQDENEDGSFFGRRLAGIRDSSWYYYCRLEADAALAMAFDLHWQRKGYLKEAKGGVAVSEESSWESPLHHAMFIRGPKSYRAVCVRAQAGFGTRGQMPNIVCAPTARSDLAEWSANLVGAVGLQVENDEPEGSPEVWPKDAFRERRYRDEGGEAFEQSFRIPIHEAAAFGEGEARPAPVAERGMKIVAIGDGTTMAIRDRVTMTRLASLEHGYTTARMIIPNGVMNRHQRTYVGEGSGVVTVDDSLSLISVNGGDVRVRRGKTIGFQLPGNRRFMHPLETYGSDELVLRSVESPILADESETLYDVVYLAIAGADASAAREVAASVRWNEESKHLVIRGTDGLGRSLDMEIDVDVWPARCDPKTVSRRISEQFLSTSPDCYEPVGFTRPASMKTGYGWNKFIFYATASLWVNALDNARLFGETNLERRLVAAFEPYFGEKREMIRPIKHVDLNVVGAVPLAIARLTGDRRAREVGLALADFQWREPRESDEMKFEQRTMDDRMGWWKQGYSDETRLWIDDMYMINLLQTEAYRLTGDRKYVDRAAREMVLYLDRLQNPDGLFFHAPDVPYVWGRGAGWMAAGMPLVLKCMDESHPCHARILDGYRKMMSALLKHQKEDGLWGQLVDDPESWSETSGSAMFAYGMAIGVKKGWLDAATYAPSVRRAWLALTAKLDEQANLAGVCIGTNKKNDRRYYMERDRLNGDPHGQAPMLWLAGVLGGGK